MTLERTHFALNIRLHLLINLSRSYSLKNVTVSSRHSQCKTCETNEWQKTILRSHWEVNTIGPRKIIARPYSWYRFREESNCSKIQERKYMSKSTTWYLIQQIFLNINTINLSTLRTLFSIQRFLFNVNAFSFSTSALQSVLNEQRQIASTKTMLLHYQLFLIFKLSHEPKAFKINKQKFVSTNWVRVGPLLPRGTWKLSTCPYEQDCEWQWSPWGPWYR